MEITTTTATKIAAGDFIRLTWTDYSGVLRTRVIPDYRYAHVCERGVGISRVCVCLPAISDIPPKFKCPLSVIGEARLVPDPSAVYQFSIQDEKSQGEGGKAVTYTLVPGSFKHYDYALAWEYCPRNVLDKMLQMLRELFQLELMVGIEHEFVLFDGDTDQPMCELTYCSNEKYHKVHKYLEELSRTLKSMGILTEQLHAESAPGQYELAIRHTTAMKAADHVVVFRETARMLAHKYNMRVSFSPKPFDDAAGSGAHIHLSLASLDDGSNVFANEMGELSEIGREFIAGMMFGLPALCAITSSSPISYCRVGPGAWAGCTTSWGTYNKEAAVRYCMLDRNVEFKPVDASANMYLALAGIVACGLYGMINKVVLEHECLVDPSWLSEEDREKLNVVNLPANVEEALDELLEGSSGAALRHYLDLGVLDTLASSKRMEHSLASAYSHAEQMKVYRYRY